jgi:hypothetical protein
MQHPSRSALSPLLPDADRALNLRGLGQVRLSTLLWFSILIPIGFVAWRVQLSLRDIVFWDEFDAVLSFIVRLYERTGWSDVLQLATSWHNEHRPLTSRLLYTLVYALTGKVNFILIGIIGNLYLLMGCVLLVLAMKTGMRRLQMGVILAWSVFQLQQHENFFWSGSSIDHFHVVMLGIAAMICLRQPDWVGFFGAVLFSFLSVFTLAHGLMILPVVSLMLMVERRWREWVIWLLWGTLLGLFFVHDFEFRPQHGALETIGSILRYWLQLLGASPGFMFKPVAEWFGFGLLVWVGVWLARGGLRREPLVASIVLFLAGAMLLIAFGRAGLNGGVLGSRYVILSSVIWALMLFTVLQKGRDSTAAPSLFVWITLGLMIFNVAANLRHVGWGLKFAQSREATIVHYRLTGSFRESAFPLHPLAQNAESIYWKAKRRGIYKFPRLCQQVSATGWSATGRIQYYIDEVQATPYAVYVRGWALVPETADAAQTIYLVLQGTQNKLAFTTRVEPRPDVAKLYNQPADALCGFNFVATRDRLPSEPLRVGIAIGDGATIDHIMTDTMVVPAGMKTISSR